MAERGQPISGLETVTDERERGLLRLADLRERMDTGQDGAVAEEAIRELQTSYEELQVSEEELRAQSQELAEAYQRLVHERQRYRDLFEHAPVGYLVTDPDGMIRDVNGTGSRLFGATQQYLRGKPLRVFVDDDARVELSRWLRDVRDADGAVTGDLRLQPHDGGPVDVRCIVAPVRGRGGEPDAVRWVIHPTDGPGQEAVSSRGLRTLAPAQDTVTDRSLEVVVLDRQPLFVRNLDVLLETLLPGRARVAGATDTPAGLAGLVDRTEPALVVVTVPAIGGPEHRAVQELRGDADGPPVLALAGGVDGDGGDVTWRLIDEGLPAVLPRTAAPDALVGAMLATAGGWTVLDGSVARVLLGPGRPLRDDLRQGLSDDDLELWRWLAMGRSDAEIATDRNVSTRTVKRRVADLYERLGVGGRVEAASLAGHYGLVDAADLDVSA